MQNIYRAALALMALLLVLAAQVCAVEIQGALKEATVAAKPGMACVLMLTNLQPGDYAVKVYDAKGSFVRNLCERYVTDRALAISWDLKDADGNAVEPGAYTIKARTGLYLSADKAFGKDGVLVGGEITNPFDVKVDGTGMVYLLNAAPAKIIKLKADGTPANDFNGANVVAGQDTWRWASLALDANGRMYVPIGHQFNVYGADGQYQYHIGGFFDTDPQWETEKKGGIGWPSWVGIGSGPRLYGAAPGYQMFSAWDATKPAKEGALWTCGRKQTDVYRVPGDAGDTDGKNVIYNASAYFTNRNTLTKLIDRGTTLENLYAIADFIDPMTNEKVALADITGVAYDREGGIFIVMRGSRKLVKLSDTGGGFAYVKHYGTEGKDPARMLFTAPRTVAASPDGKALYLVEDGEPLEKDSPVKGPAHLVKYLIGYNGEKAFTVTVTK